mmetsp:Transcript_1181/g.1980  ORF Transcript_1181/g.1980 Transcript_1181/m.1980 type:complete len:430 (+) Transcript_1181:64-1353(+)
MLRYLTQCVPLLYVIGVTGHPDAAVVRLAGGKARLFRSGQPLVFQGAVQKVFGNPSPGDVVDVVDGADSLIGWGVFNSRSMYCVRLLVTVGEFSLLGDRDISALIHTRIRQAAQRRAVCQLPSDHTNAYRLVNGEGDRLSGLAVDVFAGIAVAVSSALWVEKHAQQVCSALLALPTVDQVVWRRSTARLKQDGWELDIGAEGSGVDESAGRMGLREGLMIQENGLHYMVEPEGGQKSGFYCDQRENRQALARLCEGRRVLDLFCYSGGFSISAAAAGASSCLGVDASAAAIDLARQNAELNGLSHTCRFQKADVLAVLRQTEPASYDVVICDPPKFAPSVKDLARATPRYRKLNALVMKSLVPGGIMMTCSCSAAMSQSNTFVKMLQEAAKASQRDISLLSLSSAACDHVIHPACPESAYLTAALVHVL